MLNRSGLCMRLFGLEMFPCYPESSDCFPLATVNYLNQQSLWNKQRSRQPFLSIQTKPSSLWCKSGISFCNLK